MKSARLELRPAPCPRLAAIACLAHAAAAAFPWVVAAPWPIALPLTLLSLALLPLSLDRVPGPHASLQRLSLGQQGWQVLLRGESHDQPAMPGPGTRTYRRLVVLDLRTGGRRIGWLLTPAALSADEFRRLKARLRWPC